MVMVKMVEEGNAVPEVQAVFDDIKKREGLTGSTIFGKCSLLRQSHSSGSGKTSRS